MQTSETMMRNIERRILSEGWKITWDKKARAWYIQDEKGCCFTTAGSAASMRDTMYDMVEFAVLELLRRGHKNEGSG